MLTNNGEKTMKQLTHNKRYNNLTDPQVKHALPSAEQAAHDLLVQVQAVIGVTTGDDASLYFSDDEAWSELVQVLQSYIDDSAAYDIIDQIKSRLVVDLNGDAKVYFVERFWCALTAILQGYLDFELELAADRVDA
jgi:regulator of sigma D